MVLLFFLLQFLENLALKVHRTFPPHPPRCVRVCARACVCQSPTKSKTKWKYSHLPVYWRVKVRIWAWYKSVTQICMFEKCNVFLGKRTISLWFSCLINKYILIIYSFFRRCTIPCLVNRTDFWHCGTFSICVCLLYVSSFPLSPSVYWRGMNSGSVQLEWGWVNSHPKLGLGHPLPHWAVHKATVLLCVSRNKQWFTKPTNIWRVFDFHCETLSIWCSALE